MNERALLGLGKSEKSAIVTCWGCGYGLKEGEKAIVVGDVYCCPDAACLIKTINRKVEFSVVSVKLESLE